MNRAELSACIAALRVVPRGQALRVVTDSKYVYDGILKHLGRWRLQGRPFLNSDLWLQLQAEVDARVAPTLWRHVYSHIGVVQWLAHTSSILRRWVRTPGGIETHRTSRNPLFAFWWCLV